MEVTTETSIFPQGGRMIGKQTYPPPKPSIIVWPQLFTSNANTHTPHDTPLNFSTH